MKYPLSCAYWKEPELAFEGATRDRFEFVETFVDKGRWATYLLKCKECGQLYFYAFHEGNWAFDSNETIDLILIPVASDEDIEILKKANTRFELLELASPRLHHDNSGDKDEKTYWIK